VVYYTQIDRRSKISKLKRRNPLSALASGSAISPMLWQLIGTTSYLYLSRWRVWEQRKAMACHIRCENKSECHRRNKPISQSSFFTIMVISHTERPKDTGNCMANIKLIKSNYPKSMGVGLSANNESARTCSNLEMSVEKQMYMAKWKEIGKETQLNCLPGNTMVIQHALCSKVHPD